MQTIFVIFLTKIFGPTGNEKLVLDFAIPFNENSFDRCAAPSTRPRLIENIFSMIKNRRKRKTSYNHLANFCVLRKLAFFNFIEANLTKMDIDDGDKMNSLRFQIAITSNRLSQGSEDDRK